MRAERMRGMTLTELDGYAKAMGISAKAGKTVEDKIAIITGKRERAATLEVLGVQITVTIKAAHDGRVSELLGKSGRTEQDLRRAFELMLGKEQLDQLRDAATDEDGTFDEQAYSFGLNSILGSDELKNF